MPRTRCAASIREARDPSRRVRAHGEENRRPRRDPQWGAPREGHPILNNENTTPVEIDVEVDTTEALLPTAPVRPDSPTLAELGARPEAAGALAAAGVVHSFAIQDYPQPIGIRGADIIGQAPPGTGK